MYKSIAMKMEKDIEKLLDGVKIPSDEEVEAAGMRFDRRIRRLRMRRRMIRVTGSVAAVLCCGFVFAFLWMNRGTKENIGVAEMPRVLKAGLFNPSEAAEERDRGDFGGGRVFKKKK